MASSNASTGTTRLPTANTSQRRPASLPIGTDSIGWGILGSGERAQQMVDAIRQQPPATSGSTGAWVVGVYSHTEQRARNFAERHYLPHSFINLADLLQRRDIHAVYVASHPRHHFPLTMAALAAGKHVLCEIPMALHLDDAKAMQQAAKLRGLLLGVSHQFRVDPAIQQVRRLLADQMLGDIVGGRVANTTLLSLPQQGWRLAERGGGVLLTRTPHAVDLLCYLLDDDITAVYAAATQQILGEDTVSPVEEDVLTQVTFHRSKLTIQLHDSFFIPHIPTVLELYGSRGTLLVHHWADASRESRLWLVQNYTTQQLTFPANDPNLRLIFAFNQAIRHHLSPVSQIPPSLVATDRAGIRSLTVTLAAQDSLHSSCTTYIDPISELNN